MFFLPGAATGSGASFGAVSVSKMFSCLSILSFFIMNHQKRLGFKELAALSLSSGSIIFLIINLIYVCSCRNHLGRNLGLPAVSHCPLVACICNPWSNFLWTQMILCPLHDICFKSSILCSGIEGSCWFVGDTQEILNPIFYFSASIKMLKRSILLNPVEHTHCR